MNFIDFNGFNFIHFKLLTHDFSKESTVKMNALYLIKSNFIHSI